MHTTRKLFSNPKKPQVDGRPQPIVRVEEVDMLERAGRLRAEGLSVAVLNMASATKAGGGVPGGAGAQEENFHRRSDAKRFTMDQPTNYPIDWTACLVSPSVTVFRGTEKEGYPFLDEPFKVTMLSCPAIRKPELTEDREYQHAWQKRNMEDKIAAIVHAAVESGCHTAVLSAFGCGAFGNPPGVVARMFREQLETAPIRQVIFCIFDDHNAHKWHNRCGNILPFKNEFACLCGEAASSSDAIERSRKFQRL